MPRASLFLFLWMLCLPPILAVETKKIVVFGAGYVGLVTGSCLAEEGNRVIFIEKNPERVALLRSKNLPIREPELQELFNKGMAAGRIQVRGGLQRELADADFAFIAVPTPTSETGEPQLQAVQEVIEEIITALEKGGSPPIIVMRSTILPLKFQELESYCAGQNPPLSLVMNPEFLRESTAVQDFYHPPFCVAGGKDLHAVQSVLDLYEKISPKRFALTGSSACLVKYGCNAFHALKIAFANEISSTCESLEIDPVALMDLLTQDTQLNVSKAYLRPGFSFGGSCLKKDLKALLCLNESLGEASPLLGSIVQSNQCRYHKVLKTILNGNHIKLAVLGISFKKNSDDIRDSPYLDLVEALNRESISLRIYDPDIDLKRLKSSQRELFDQRIAPLLPYFHEELLSALSDCDGIVLCKDYLDQPSLQEALRNGIPLYDLGYYRAQTEKMEKHDH